MHDSMTTAARLGRSALCVVLQVMAALNSLAAEVSTLRKEVHAIQAATAPQVATAAVAGGASAIRPPDVRVEVQAGGPDSAAPSPTSPNRALARARSVTRLHRRLTQGRAAAQDAGGVQSPTEVACSSSPGFVASDASSATLVPLVPSQAETPPSQAEAPPLTSEGGR